MKYYIETDFNNVVKVEGLIYTEDGSNRIEITDCIQRKYSGINFNTPFYVSLDNKGVPLSGTSSSIRPVSGKYVDISKSISINGINNDLLDPDTLYGVVMVGHSIAANMSYQSTYPTGWSDVNQGNNKKVAYEITKTTLGVYDNTLFPHISGNSLRGLDRPAQAKIRDTSIGSYNTCVLLTNEMSRRIQEKTGKIIQFIGINGALNGSSIDDCRKGTQAFTILQDSIQVAKNYATSISKNFMILFVLQIHGEGESIFTSVTGEQIKPKFIQYYRELKTMIETITSQSIPPKFYRHQQHINSSTDERNTEIKLAQEQVEYPPIVFPMTAIDNASGFEHPGTFGTFKYVGIAINNIFKDIYQKNKFKPFKFKSYTINGNNIILKFNVPVKPIKIDTSRGGTVISETFTLLNGVSEIIINSVTVTGDDELTINCQSSPIGYTLYYKHKRPYLVTDPYGRNQADIIDSDNSYFYNIPSPSYLISFSKLIS